MLTQPYYDLFVKLATWGAKYGNDIFWEPWPMCLPGYAGGGIASGTVKWYYCISSTAFNMKAQ